MHRNAYTLDNVVNNATDWRTNETTLAQQLPGDTEVIALYAQDAWAAARRPQAHRGLARRVVRTCDGEQLARVAACTPGGGAACVPNGDGTFNKIGALRSPRA